MAKPKRKGKRKKSAPPEPKRTKGFHCAYCRRSAPHNERFVPDYYRAQPGHRRDQHMCYACHEEGVNRGKRNRKPRLNADTLKQFWMEDTSESHYIAAAADFFEVPMSKISEVLLEIKV